MRESPRAAWSPWGFPLSSSRDFEQNNPFRQISKGLFRDLLGDDHLRRVHETETENTLKLQRQLAGNGEEPGRRIDFCANLEQAIREKHYKGKHLGRFSVVPTNFPSHCPPGLLGIVLESLKQRDQFPGLSLAGSPNDISLLVPWHPKVNIPPRGNTVLEEGQTFPPRTIPKGVVSVVTGLIQVDPGIPEEKTRTQVLSIVSRVKERSESRLVLPADIYTRLGQERRDDAIKPLSRSNMQPLSSVQ